MPDSKFLPDLLPNVKATLQRIVDAKDCCPLVAEISGDYIQGTG